MNGAANVVPLQVSGSGALANSLCELEMIKRNRRWYMEVRTDVALSNIETHLDFGLGLDAAENFHNFVAEAQNFHKEYRPLLRGNRSILNLGIKGLSSPPVGGISSKSNSDNSSSDKDSLLAHLRPRSLRDLLEAKSSGALARALAAQSEDATPGDPFMQAFGGLAASMEATEQSIPIPSDRGGTEAIVPYQASGGGFNPSFDTTYPAPGNRESTNIWLEVDPSTSLAQLRCELLLRLRIPLLQHRADNQLAIGDHDGGEFASSEVHWSHPSRDRLRVALSRNNERRSLGRAEIPVSKYKLSVPLPGADGGVHVFSIEEEAKKAPLF